MTMILVAIAGILIVANVIATAAVMRSGAHSPPQKLGQILLVWLLPAFGAIGVGVFYCADRQRGLAGDSSSDPTSITDSYASMLDSAPTPDDPGR